MDNGDIIQRVQASFIEKEARTGIHPAFKIKKRRSAADRLKARMQYRKNKNKIKIWRKRYKQKRKMLHASRKMLKRTGPSWLRSKKSHKPKKNSFKSLIHHLTHGPKNHGPKRPSTHAPKTHSFKIHKPKSHVLKPFKPKKPSSAHH